LRMTAEVSMMEQHVPPINFHSCEPYTTLRVKAMICTSSSGYQDIII